MAGTAFVPAHPVSIYAVRRTRRRRRLVLGLPLLLGLRVDELTAVLGHESGHVGRRVRPRLRRSPGSGPLGVRLSLALDRREELRCDVVATRIAGEAAMRAALRRISLLTWAHRRSLADCLGPGAATGVRRRRPFEALTGLIAEPGREREL